MTPHFIHGPTQHLLIPKGFSHLFLAAQSPVKVPEPCAQLRSVPEPRAVPQHPEGSQVLPLVPAGCQGATAGLGTCLGTCLGTWLPPAPFPAASLAAWPCWPPSSLPGSPELCQVPGSSRLLCLLLSGSSREQLGLSWPRILPRLTQFLWGEAEKRDRFLNSQIFGLI